MYCRPPAMPGVFTAVDENNILALPCCSGVCIQASPYVVGLFIFPVHYFTHIFLLFFSGVWATNIHDSVVSERVY